MDDDSARAGAEDGRRRGQDFLPESMENGLAPKLSEAESSPSPNESNSPLMCPSTEFISILPQDRTDGMILYVNPKVLGYDQLLPGPWTSMDSFLSSEMDLELEAIFQEYPPVLSGFLIKCTKLRAILSPVTGNLNIGVYHSTIDLDQMGHASYFFGIMTPEERTAIGWKPPLNPAQWDSLRRILSSKVTWPGSLGRKVRGTTRNNSDDTRNGSGKEKSRTTWIWKIKKRLPFPPIPKWNFWKHILPSCAHGRHFVVTDAQEHDDLVMIPSVLSPFLPVPLQFPPVPFKFPPPIMIPVLTRKDKVWFFGNSMPEDHEPIRVKYKRDFQHQQFSKFHQKANEKFSENGKLKPSNCLTDF